MHPTDELIRILKKLRLSGVLGTLDLRTRQSVDDNLSHSEFLGCPDRLVGAFGGAIADAVA